MIKWLHSQFPNNLSIQDNQEFIMVSEQVILNSNLPSLYLPF